jgi:molecular chaperone HscB
LVVNNPFDMLGLPARFGIDSKELDALYRKLSRSLHPDRHAHAPPGERRHSLDRAIDVGDAYRLLRDPQRRAKWLLDRAFELAGPIGAGALEAEHGDPEFLMDIMQQREALSEARHARDLDAALAMGKRMQQRYEGALARLQNLLDDGAIARLLAAGAADSAASLTEQESGALQRALSEASDVLSKLRYYRRFLDEVATTEDELD